MAIKTINTFYEEISKINDSIKNLDKIKNELNLAKDNIEEKYNLLEETLNDLKKETKTKENYNNIQSLYTFDSFFDFKDFVKELYNIHRWKLSDASDEERIDKLKDKDYFIKLKHDFNSKKLSPYPITNREILSYLDTLSILYKILEEIQMQDFKKNVKIIMEYVPKYDKGKDRCDYVLAYKDSLMLLEFGKCMNKENAKSKKIEKDKMLSQYEQQIKRLVGSIIKIKTNPIIYFPEKDDESIQENFDIMKNTIQLIKRWIGEANKSAIDYLNEEE